MTANQDPSPKESANQTVSNPKEDELVLVVPTSAFRELGEFQGFSREAVANVDALFHSEKLRFLRRGDAERDPNFKQLIPYVLFTWTDATGEVFVFAYRRGQGQGERRLVAKWSVGVGGHVNDADSREDGASLFDAGVEREIHEEVALESSIRSFQKVGLVNDDLTEVGKVHLGVVCRVELEEPNLRSNEPDLLEARFRPVAELLREIDDDPTRFESWTTLALDGLFRRDVRAD